ncbi:MAG: PAS domain S-box protein, partial [Methanoregula sp.]|nr:PAS domain S-box protein [Methanoregula sp.]
YLQKGGDPRSQFAELRHKIIAALERRRAVDALRDSEQKLSDIINFLPDATFAINTKGQVIAWNKAIETMTGIPARDMLGKGQFGYATPFYGKTRPMLIDLVLAPDDRFESENYIDLCHTGTTLTAETLIGEPGNNPLHLWSKASRFYDKSGNIAGAIESVRDITEQKKIDQTLRENEAKYRELVENASSIILKLDNSGNITFFNEFAQKFFGFSNNEILGRPVVGTVVPLQECNSHRDLAGMIGNLIHNPEDYVNNETENITKNGERVWIHWWNKPIFDQNGVLDGVLCVGTDITARKHIEDELRMENEKNRGLMNHACDAIFIIDAETGMFTDANKKGQELVGRPLGELRTLHYFGIHPAESREIYRGYFATITDEGTGSYSMVVINNDGRHIPVIASSTAIDLGGRRHIMEIFHDISEIQMAQDALQLANKKLNLLAEITRHDIRNRLTVLGGYLDLVKEHPREPEYSMYLRKIQDLVGNIGENIEFTQLYQNLGVVAPGWQKVHDIFFHSCARTDIRKIYVQSDTGGVEIFADPLLERAFYNLAENAVLHGGRVTTIRISAHESEDGVTIIVEDDGTGIPPSDKVKIFSKGYGKNTGLGLFLVEQILSITGITIQETGEYHKGARFEMHVPRGAYRYPKKESLHCHIRVP